MSRSCRGSLGSPRIRSRACFHALARSSPIDRPLSVHSGSFSHEAVPLQSTFASTAVRRLSTRTLLPGVSSLIATSPERIHIPHGFPVPCFVPPSGFLSLSTVSSAPRLRGLVSSHRRVQGSSPVQGLLPLHVRPSSSEGDAPLPLGPRPLSDSRMNRHPRPSTSTSRLCSVKRCVPWVWCYPPRRSLPSSGSRSSRLSLSSAVALVTQGQSLMAFPLQVSACAST